jgi:lipopolysaccharide export system permease protein
LKRVADDASHVRNVFVSEAGADRLGVTMAGSGYQEVAENGDRFIVLNDGRRYEFVPGSGRVQGSAVCALCGAN